MITQHPVDNLTMMRAIELLDRYSWLLTQSKDPHHAYDKQFLPVILANLRTALKTEVRTK